MLNTPQLAASALVAVTDRPFHEQLGQRIATLRKARLDPSAVGVAHQTLALYDAGRCCCPPARY